VLGASGNHVRDSEPLVIYSLFDPLPGHRDEGWQKQPVSKS
jgi:hypothetical protein